MSVTPDADTPAVMPRDVAGLGTYLLRLGDDALVLSHRLAEWVTNAPQLEEDVALANIGLDLLGQARTLLAYAAEVEGAGRSEDDFAYLRDAEAFRNVHLAEIPNGDFAVSMARLLVFSSWQLLLLRRLVDSSDPMLAGYAGKAVKEVDYHRDHATQWVLRLGDGTPVSHQRMQAGVDAVWPYVAELFETDDIEQALVQQGIAADAPSLRAEWDQYVDGVLAEATLSRPPAASPASGGGRRGVHTPDLAALLDTMQQLHRAHPGVTW